MDMLTLEQREKRLRARIAEFRFWVDRESVSLTNWSFDGEALELGASWPHTRGVHHFEHPEITVPASWTLSDVRLALDVGGESLVRVRYDGRTDQFGLDPNHQQFPVRASSFGLSIEAVARLPFGVPNRNARLARADLVLIDQLVDRLVRRLSVVAEAAHALQEKDVAGELLSAAERSLADLRWPSSTAPYLRRVRLGGEQQSIWELPVMSDEEDLGLSHSEQASVRGALDGLEEELQKLRDTFPQEGSFALTGHAHIDLAWLWPMHETRRKAQRTFSTTVDLMDRYPEFIFNQSSAQIYAFLEEDDPNLFERIKERVTSGQWEPIGGMWVEPDTNMAAGESLVRQLLYGQRYFHRHFGRYHTVSWLPDVFGFTPALPQLLKLAGIEDFFTIKLTWSETNSFPHDLFWWEGLDGTRILAHMFNNPGGMDADTDGYNADPGPESLVRTWHNFRGRKHSAECLLSIGYGDGGGGVTAEMMDRARETRLLPAVPSAQFSAVEDFFERTRRRVDSESLPVWVGELYLELHRGTLTTQGLTKYTHRRAERSLVAAEVLASLAHLVGGPVPPSMEKSWHRLLRNEFHDILPGSSIREVNEQAVSEMSESTREAGAVLTASLDTLANAVCPPGDVLHAFVLNPDMAPRVVRATLNEPIPGVQAVDEGYLITADGTVPGLAAVTVRDFRSSGELSVSDAHLENRFLHVGLSQDGSIHRVLDKVTGREVLDGKANTFWAHVDKPSTWDAWDIDAEYAQSAEYIPASTDPVVVEQGPHRVAIRTTRVFRASTITQDIRLWSNSRRIDFKTTIDWHDRRWLVKVRFPVAVRSTVARFETAFGMVERPTHRNTSWAAAQFEVAAHRFVDLSEPGYGVALLNDGKYGHHVWGNELGLSLLRSPVFPDPLADEGIQTFTYSLLPHTGDMCAGCVVHEADDLNMPLLARVVRAGGTSTWQAFELGGIPLGLGALKPLEDSGGLLLRAYEPYGARGRSAIVPPRGWKLDAEVDVLERRLGPPEQHFTPFQVHTWRVIRDGQESV